jgi:hypothetical protein
MPSISGTVNKGGAPLERAYVRLLGPSGEFVAEEYTGGDGAFKFHVVDGSWTLEVRSAGAETVKETVELSGQDANVSLQV